ncbi:MAG TPA: VOC family protein [Sphingobium sp.]|nr:VOC family protein [Sphingobium sp.]
MNMNGIYARGFAAALLACGMAVPASAEPAPAPASAPAGSIIGTGLRVSDLDRSIRFYTDILGMRVTTKLPHGTLTEVIMHFAGGGGAGILLLSDSAPGKSPPIALGNGYEKMVVNMADLDGVVARMKKAGLSVGEVHQAMGIKVLLVTDPDGYRYELIQMGKR